MPRAFDLVDRRRSPWSSSRRSCSIAAIAIRLGSRGPVIYRQRRVGRDGREFEMLKLRTMVAGLRPGRRRHRRHPRRPAGHRRRPLPAPHLARRDPQPGQRPARRDGDRRPAPDDPRPGRRLHARASTAATRSGPGSPAGPRSRAAPASPGRSGSSSTSSTSTTAAPPSTCASSPRPPGCSSPATASPRTERDGLRRLGARPSA